MEFLDLMYFPFKGTLNDVGKGHIFKHEGTYYLKTEYRYSNDNQHYMVIILGTGEFAHFPLGNDQPVEMMYEPDYDLWAWN